jgi:hypothetical protein
VNPFSIRQRFIKGSSFRNQNNAVKKVQIKALAKTIKGNWRPIERHLSACNNVPIETKRNREPFPVTADLFSIRIGTAMRRNQRHLFHIILLLLEAPHRAPPITSLPGVSSDEFQHAAWLLSSQGYVLVRRVNETFEVTALTWSGYDYADAHKTFIKKIGDERPKNSKPTEKA